MFGVLAGKRLELCALVVLVCHCELPGVAVCQARWWWWRGETGIFSPGFCSSSQGLQCPKCSSGKGKNPSKDSGVVLLACLCSRQSDVWSWQEAGLGKPPVGGQLAPRSLAFLSKQRLLPRDVWAPKKPHLALCYRSNSFWNGLPFKRDGLLVVLWGQRVNKIIFVCCGIA